MRLLLSVTVERFEGLAAKSGSARPQDAPPASLDLHVLTGGGVGRFLLGTASKALSAALDGVWCIGHENTSDRLRIALRASDEACGWLPLCGRPIPSVHHDKS